MCGRAERRSLAFAALCGQAGKKSGICCFQVADSSNCSWQRLSLHSLRGELGIQGRQPLLALSLAFSFLADSRKVVGASKKARKQESKKARKQESKKASNSLTRSIHASLNLLKPNQFATDSLSPSDAVGSILSLSRYHSFSPFRSSSLRIRISILKRHRFPCRLSLAFNTPCARLTTQDPPRYSFIISDPGSAGRTKLSVNACSASVLRRPYAPLLSPFYLLISLTSSYSRWFPCNGILDLLHSSKPTSFSDHAIGAFPFAIALRFCRSRLTRFEQVALSTSFGYISPLPPSSRILRQRCADVSWPIS